MPARGSRLVAPEVVDEACRGVDEGAALGPEPGLLRQVDVVVARVGLLEQLVSLDIALSNRDYVSQRVSEYDAHTLIRMASDALRMLQSAKREG